MTQGVLCATVNISILILMYLLTAVGLTPGGSSTVQCSTVECSTVQYSTVQHSTVQYSTVQYSTAQYNGLHVFLSDFNETCFCRQIF